MSTLSDVLAVLDLDPAGDGRFVGHNLPDTPGGVVFGGQLLGQVLVAASLAVPDKQVLSMHTVFARGATRDEALDIEVDVVQNGRSFATAVVDVRQRGRVCVTSTSLLHAPDPDLIRHQPAAPVTAAPEDLTPLAHELWWDVRIDGDVDISDPALTGPAELRVWSRVPGAPDDPTTNKALLAYATDGFLIATAMRPHAGFGQSLAHVTVSTTVLAQTLTFHEPFSTDGWLLLDQRSTTAGRGRSHGLGEVFTADGALVASFAQENMIRDMPEAHRPPEGGKSAF